MPFLADIKASTLNGDDPKELIAGIVKQLNEWGREISNENRTKIINDDTGTPRILIGYQEDGF